MHHLFYTANTILCNRIYSQENVYRIAVYISCHFHCVEESSKILINPSSCTFEGWTCRPSLFMSPMESMRPITNSHSSFINPDGELAAEEGRKGWISVVLTAGCPIKLLAVPSAHTIGCSVCSTHMAALVLVVRDRIEQFVQDKCYTRPMLPAC